MRNSITQHILWKSRLVYVEKLGGFRFSCSELITPDGKCINQSGKVYRTLFINPKK